MSRLRAVFLGTPRFAVPSLEALLDEAEVVAVVSQPDRPRGRGRQVAPPPVAEAARARGVRLLQPDRLRSPEVLETLSALAPEVNVTVAYGKLIPREVLELPRLGSINVHPSLLPKYRGASPIVSAILNGETETGVTIMYMSMELDSGDIIIQRRIAIAPDDTARTLEARLARLGADALVEALRLMAAGRAPRIPQDHAAATYAGKLGKEHGRIDWTKPAPSVVNLVRAMDPWPSAYTTHRGQLLKVWRAVVVDDAGAALAGTVLDRPADEGIMVAAGQGAVRLLEVQPEGRRRMTAIEYARGARLQPGERLAEESGGSNAIMGHRR